MCEREGGCASSRSLVTRGLEIVYNKEYGERGREWVTSSCLFSSLCVCNEAIHLKTYIMENTGTKTEGFINKFDTPSKDFGIKVQVKKRQAVAIEGVEVTIPAAVAIKTMKKVLLSNGFLNSIAEKAAVDIEYKALLDSHYLLVAILQKALDINDFHDDVDFVEQIIGCIAEYPLR